MSSHTQGPWHTGGRDGLIIYAADGWAVANATVSHARHGGLEVAQANAAAIAVVPELLEALREMVKNEGAHSVGCKEYPPGFDDSRCCPVHIARTAIANATGGA